ncbi:MAG: LptF/LptG family permease [Candidatus Omnitrophica bacterium]|nr:LptF/LptG family permease [Candidatus Omnitrophota bacterium]
MKLLDQYTLRAYLAPLAWCLIIFMGLYLMLDLLGHLDEILRYRVPARLLLTYYATMVPLIFVQVAPFACLMATLYTLSHFNRHLEIMAMRASGLSPWAISRPVIWMAVFMSACVFVVNETVAPRAAQVTSEIKEGRLERPADPARPHKVLKMIEHLAAYGQGHTLLYAKTFDPVEKRLEGVVILQHGENLRLIRKITADSALWTGSAWRFLDGTILHFSAEGRAVGRPVPFTAKIIEAGDRPEVLEKAEAQAEFMNMQDLHRYIARMRGTGGATVQKLSVDFYAKPAAALACLVLTLIGIPFAIQPVRGGTVLGLSMGLGIGLGFFGANAFSVALGKGGWLPPLIAAWAAPISFAWFGLRKAWEKLA